MFDQPGGDLQAHPLFVAKNVDLPLEGIARFAGAFLRRFQPAFACGNGSDADHREWRFMHLTRIRLQVAIYFCLHRGKCPRKRLHGGKTEWQRVGCGLTARKNLCSHSMSAFQTAGFSPFVLGFSLIFSRRRDAIFSSYFDSERFVKPNRISPPMAE